ncbi:ATP-binding cassette domain-containing protein [Nocardiopsis composta]|uniref:ABC-2 type transport system ATP-binding protein n=1 Tax=Nocardiopsis composta TaxID=157465 RepID=A0A7W8QLG8_9ACTN|nr:ATP-binding cassette domain-containing protein [Nocardiopsis composta]MBB5431646.1 ABC-2 type transport system ATP-binding protein [Nocardiopsis composta]
MAAAEFAVRAVGVRKRYGAHLALDGFDLEVRPGTVHALLGPNGAGKTTAVRVLSTLARFDSGHALVNGFDVVAEAPRVRRTIGLTGQYAAVDEVLTGRENLVMFGRLFGLAPRAARERADELLAAFRLEDAADRRASGYSGGMRRRLDLAAGLIQHPPVLFLDEPTTGLDPRSRGEVWDAVRGLVEGGTTVLLTTQYLDEADRLADRVTVIDGGRVIVEDGVDGLKSRFGGDRVEVAMADDAGAAAAERLLAPLGGARAGTAEGVRIGVPAADRMRTLTRVVRTLDDAGIVPADVSVRRPTLDEVFLSLTGSGRPAGAPPGGTGATEQALPV